MIAASAVDLQPGLRLVFCERRKICARPVRLLAEVVRNYPRPVAGHLRGSDKTRQLRFW
jgi:hypothetical protein